MNRFKTNLVIAVLFISSVAAGVVQAQEFRLGYTDSKPFIWKEKNEPRGIFVDIIREAMEKRMGIPVVFIEKPAKRLVYDTRNGNLDGFIEVATADRLKDCVTGRVPVAVGMFGAFTYKNHPEINVLAEADTLNELKKYTVLTFLGDDWAKEHLQGFTIDSGAKNTRNNIQKLNQKRGDLIIQLEQVAHYYIRELGFEDVITQLPNVLLPPVFYQLFVSKKTSFSTLPQTLDKTLTVLLNEGYINKVYGKYKVDIKVRKTASRKRPKVRYITYADLETQQAVNQIAANFNANQNKYRLKPIFMEMEKYKQAVKVMLSGGESADMIMTWAGYRTQYLVDLNFVEPIDDIWTADNMNSLFPPSIAEGMVYNGHKYAVPLTHHIVQLIYNKHIFKKYNIQIPKTWQNFLDVCEQLKSHGITPIALGSKERWPIQSWFDNLLIRTAGPEYRSRLMTGEASFVDPEVKKAFALLKILLDHDYINENCNDLDYREASSMLYREEAAMTLDGTWSFGNYEVRLGWKGGEDFDFFPFPAIEPDIPQAVIGVMDVILVIHKEQTEGGKSALSYFAEKENQMYYSSYSGSLAPNMQVPQEFYPPLLQKVARVIREVPVEVFSYDLSTPPHVAEIGLSLFKDFLQTPGDVDRLLEEADRNIQDAFSMLPAGTGLSD